MQFSYLVANDTTGTLAPNHTTHSPVIATTTVEVKDSTGKVLSTNTATARAQTSKLGTTTSTSTDAKTGNVTTTTVVTAFDTGLTLGKGNSLVGIYDDDKNPMPADFQIAYDNPQAWLYQNGKFVSNPNYAAIQLADAKDKQNTVIEHAYTSLFVGGFTSSADGTQRTYSADAQALQELGWIRSVPQSEFPATGIEAKLIDGTHIFLSYSQMQTLITDAQTFFMTNRAKKILKLKQIAASTAAAQPPTVGWPNPNPPAVPTGLTATPGTADVSLSWTANTDVTMIGGGGYNVYQDGVKVNSALVTGETYTASGLTSGASYNFSITAVDTDGNESAQCAAVSATPQ